MRQYNLNVDYTNRYQPFSFSTLEINGDFLHVFKNFWDVTLTTIIHPVWEKDYYELRTPGSVFKKVPWAFFGVKGSTDSRKKLFVNYFIGYANFSPIPDDPFILLDLGARYRFNAKFNVSLEGERQYDKGNMGWALFDPVTSAPIAGLRAVTQFSTTLNAVYNFKARMNLNMRVRHYWSKVAYKTFYDVLPSGDWTERPFIDNQNENFNAFNLDMFFTWDFRLGSRLIIAWKNALGPDASINGILNNKYGNNFKEVFNVPHSNEISVKFVYYIDAQKFIKKKG